VTNLLLEYDESVDAAYLTANTTYRRRTEPLRSNPVANVSQKGVWVGKTARGHWHDR
jgi:hypothetical protein